MPFRDIIPHISAVGYYEKKIFAKSFLTLQDCYSIIILFPVTLSTQKTIEDSRSVDSIAINKGTFIYEKNCFF